jgi:hypothetical protein
MRGMSVALVDQQCFMPRTMRCAGSLLPANITLLGKIPRPAWH